MALMEARTPERDVIDALDFVDASMAPSAGGLGAAEMGRPEIGEPEIIGYIPHSWRK